MIGIVYYEDDKKVFRIVYPSHPDHLDGPALETNPNGGLRVMRDEKGNPLQWHTFGTNPNRKAVFEKVARDDPRAVLTGTA